MSNHEASAHPMPRAARNNKGLGTRRSVGANTAHNTTPNRAKPASREAGTASAFQIPPRPSSVPGVLAKASARGAKA
ncbi:hypothetical protein GCM10028828_20360 [Corynebacterium tapiri]